MAVTRNQSRPSSYSITGATEPAGTKNPLLEQHKINLGAGETHRLELGGLGAAGYSWEHTIEGSQGIITVWTEPLGTPAHPPPGGPPPDSYSRDELFVITALEPGTTRIRLFLRRPWEHDKQPLREILLEISVSK